MATRHLRHLNLAKAHGIGTFPAHALDKYIIRLALLLSCAAVLLISVSVVQDLVQARLFSTAVPDKIWLLDIDSEESIFTWLSSIVLFVDALLLFLVASDCHYRHLPFATHWYVLAIGFVGLSFDEAVSLHEKLSSVLHSALDTSGAFAFAWVIPALIFCGLLFLFYVPFLRALPARIGGALFLAGLLYVGGAVGVEMIAGSLYEHLPLDSLPYRMVTSIEETMEISGALLLAFVVGSNLALLMGEGKDAPVAGLP